MPLASSPRLLVGAASRRRIIDTAVEILAAGYHSAWQRRLRLQL